MPTQQSAPVRPVQGKTSTDATSSGSRRGRKAFLAFGAVVAALLLGIALYALFTLNLETTDDAQIEADVVPVSPRVTGLISQFHVTEDQHVRKGDLILELDDADFSARLEQAQAQLATAEAQAAFAEAQEKVTTATATGGLRSAQAMVSNSSSGVAAADAQVAAAKAAVERAQAEVRRTSLDLDRARELRAANAVPQERLDNTQIAADSARAALAQASASLTAAAEDRRGATSRVTEAEGRLAQSSPVDAQMAAAHAASELARARVREAQAAAKLAQLQVSYTRVASPQDGVVSKLTAHEGQLVSAGQPVAELVPDHSYVIANFKETQLERMRPGERATVQVDAFPHHTLEGRVETLSGGTGSRFSLMPSDNATGNFVKVVQRVPVRISFVNPPAELPLKAGLSVTVTVHLEKN